MYIIKRLVRKVVKISNYILFISSLLLVFMTSILIVWIEPETFPTFFDGLWWVMTTVTTVGYGDLFPVTFEGKLLALFLYVFGIGLIGVVIGKIIDGLAIYRKKREEGDIVYKDKGHYIIIGWSQKAKYAVQEMIATSSSIDMIIIDTLEKAPLLNDQVQYINGNATDKETLEKANIQEAKSVLIFSDDNIVDAELADGKSMLIASAVEAMAPEVHTIVEVMEENHLKNFEYMQVNEFIISNETISSLFVRSAYRNGISGIFSQLLKRTKGDDLYYIPAKQTWNTYRDAFNELLEQGATLVSDRNQLNINRKLDEKLPDDAELYVICDTTTYQKILKDV
ncbi:potassium channel protein [Gracilibacillus halophilus YIM-C55.5]|uniref:Potassium channel protein n=1 Tax=Gracilibacillus halophilus YIM-C55.5 TaxID=1308866 RepID=N4W6G2_9BACI|nr:potassium channel family protein [Gracilibacillus halophilus]ENH95803.1 potassium channel protein [Gracilibacillus halophilus YIM-C55.5]